ncbi:MAG: LL-diaminopimelate aminotransferase [Clostridia bacterium]|jgi:LL-diaminopimelate aminotransferase|nr:LL-diaminopimelate aminotransferase [Clostridia bacterium]
MIKVNENFFKLDDNYLFSKILAKKQDFIDKNPNKRIINMGVGDVSLPLVPCVIKAMHAAVEEMANKETFRGYGLVEGYKFLREKINEIDYKNRGIDLDENEIFISNGSKCDLGNMVDLFSNDNIVAIANPVYPVYRDTNIIAGRNKIVYLDATEQNGFLPQIPNEKVDMIYLCCPNNPTGAVFTKEQLEKWVQYAKENKSIILFDSVYEVFITDDNVLHSIYEIEGAKEVAIEFRSLSKLAGFTGVRCSYVVIPKELKVYTAKGDEVYLNRLWYRRQSAKFGGVSYVTQRGAEAVYSEEGQKQIKENVKYYLENAAYIKQELEKLGMKVYGAKNSPYIWLKVPNGEKSWDFFDKLLNKTAVIGTPGVGFGSCGEGFFRLTSFGSKEDSIEFIERLKKII